MFLLLSQSLKQYYIKQTAIGDLAYLMAVKLNLYLKAYESVDPVVLFDEKNRGH
jgi:hypothetical protein